MRGISSRVFRHIKSFALANYYPPRLHFPRQPYRSSYSTVHPMSELPPPVVPSANPRDYENWTPAQLIARIKDLENKSTAAIRPTAGVGASPQAPEPTASTPTPAQTIPTTATAAAVTSTSTPTRLPLAPYNQPKPRRKQRDFDWSKYAKRRIALKVAYFGWDYFGFATQGDNDQLQTVEAKLFQSLQKCRLIENPSQCRYTRCGRTDRGVSGLGQVVALDIRSCLPADQVESVLGGIRPGTEEPAEGSNPAGRADLPGDQSNLAQVSRSAPAYLDQVWRPATELGISAIPSPSCSEDAAGPDGPTPSSESDETVALNARELPYIRMLNRDLPADIRVVAWAPVPLDFNARFDCIWRHYKYYFSDDGYPPLQVDRMREAARKFLGPHDFRYFCKIDPAKEITNFERTVLEIDITPVEDPAGGLPHRDLNHLNRLPRFYQLDLRGSAFLWHQVRCMVGILLLVGQGLEAPSVVDQLLTVDPNQGKPAYPMASEMPLILYDSYYQPRLTWRYDSERSFQPLRLTHQRLTEMWTEHSIKALTARAGLEQLNRLPVPQPQSNLRFGDASTQQLASLGVHLVTLVSSGGGQLVPNRKYVPLLERARQSSVDVTNERYQAKKRRKLMQEEAEESTAAPSEGMATKCSLIPNENEQEMVG
ncbi:pseudouridine synthase deg1 [Dimargaris cristalligena]|nr:pseudouridine synthase deg1 [Dimargaris cristalligena]